MFDPEQIRRNPQEGDGPCHRCAAYTAGDGVFVNTGLVNLDGDLVFVTQKPRHRLVWAAYDSWAEYNEEWTRWFAGRRGGRVIGGDRSSNTKK